jgi:anti-sigma B factor antagonist
VNIATKSAGEGVRIVTISGRFTMGAESMEVETLMDSLVAQKDRRFVFDLSNVEFIDSSGLGILVNCLRKAQKLGGELRVVASPRVAGIIKVVRLDQVLPLYTDVAAASRHFTSEEDSGPIGAA